MLAIYLILNSKNLIQRENKFIFLIIDIFFLF